MKILATVMAIALAASLASVPALAEDNTVTVTGKAEIKAKPDVAYVTLYVKADGILMVDAIKRADKKVEEINTAIHEKFQNVQSFDVVDVALGEKQREYWGPDRKDETPRPEVARRLRIALPPNPKQVYELVDVAIRNGALMQISSSVRYSEDIRSVVVYGLVKSAEFEENASQKAMADAKKKAQKMAALAEKSIGDVVKIGCTGIASFGIPMRVMGRPADFPTEHVGTNPNEVTISHAVSVTFELKSK